MPTDYVSFDNIAVAPTPPGVFATSMPSEFSSEDYLSVSNMQLHNSSLMGGSAYPKSISSSPKYLSTTPRTTKSSDYSMTKKEDLISNKGKNKKSENNELLLHPKKSGVELFRNSRVRSSPPCSENGTPSQENKSLKVTIRRNSDFSNLDNHHAHKIEKRDMDCKPEAGGVDDVSNITSIFRSPESYPCSRTITSIANKIEPDLEISSKISSYNKQDELLKTSNFDKQLGTEPCSSKDVSTNTETDCATTELDSRLQCEPGSKVVLEGVVWLETPGMVVINAHWRGRTYLGTLLDSSKKTLSSSCPDKMISALSLVQRRRNRNAGKNHRKRSCNCISKLPIHNIGNSETRSLNSRLSGNGCCGAAMTTRSAAAAAAAAPERFGSDMEKNNDRASEISFCKRRYVSSTKQRRGATKRKSRSGLSFGSESGNVCTKSTTLRNIKSRRNNPHHLLAGTTTSLAVSKRNKSFHRNLQHSDEDENQKLKTAKNLDTMDIIFSHSECLKGAEIDKGLDSGDAITSINSVHLNKPKISSISKEITITKQVEDSANKIELPPCLAMAKHDITYLAPCADDDDQPPPKLDRGPGTEDELVGMENHMKPDLIEPPTASPAYSDISDDAETDKNPSSRLSHQSLHSNMSWNSSERRNRSDSLNSQKIALHVRKKHFRRKNLSNPSISTILFNDHTGSRDLKSATSSWKFSPHNLINTSSPTNQGIFVPQIVNNRSCGIFRLDKCNDSAYNHNLPTFLSEQLAHLSDTDVLSSKPISFRNNSSFSTTELLSPHPRALQLPADFEHHDECQDDTKRISKKMKSAGNYQFMKTKSIFSADSPTGSSRQTKICSKVTSEMLS